MSRQWISASFTITRLYNRQQKASECLAAAEAASKQRNAESLNTRFPVAMEPLFCVR